MVSSRSLYCEAGSVDTPGSTTAASSRGDVAPSDFQSMEPSRAAAASEPSSSGRGGAVGGASQNTRSPSSSSRPFGRGRWSLNLCRRLWLFRGEPGARCAMARGVSAGAGGARGVLGAYLLLLRRRLLLLFRLQGHRPCGIGLGLGFEQRREGLGARRDGVAAREVELRGGPDPCGGRGGLLAHRLLLLGRHFSSASPSPPQPPVIEPRRTWSVRSGRHGQSWPPLHVEGLSVLPKTTF